MLTAADIMFATGWGLRATQRYLRRCLVTRHVSVRLVSNSGRGRSYYLVDAESFFAAWPRYREGYEELVALRSPLAA